MICNSRRQGTGNRARNAVRGAWFKKSRFYIVLFSKIYFLKKRFQKWRYRRYGGTSLIGRGLQPYRQRTTVIHAVTG